MRSREPVVVQEGGYPLVVPDKLFRLLIQFLRPHSRLYHPGNFSVSLRQYLCAFSYELDLLFCFQVNHLKLCSCRAATKIRTSFYSSRLHHPFVVSHEQIAFNLLQCVENNTYKDQKRSTPIKLCEVLFPASSPVSRPLNLSTIFCQRLHFRAPFFWRPLPSCLLLQCVRA